MREHDGIYDNSHIRFEILYGVNKETLVKKVMELENAISANDDLLQKIEENASGVRNGV